MDFYLQGLALGLAYVAPIGMQNLFVINSALTQTRLRALATALIVIFFDVTLALACFFGMRGRGLLNAIQLTHPCAHAAMDWALEHGLIVNAVAPDALRLAPPLIVSERDVDEAVAILAAVPNDLPND